MDHNEEDQFGESSASFSHADSNSAKRLLDEQDGVPANKKKGKTDSRQYLSSAAFNINKEAMLDLANDCLDPELKLLGVTSFNQNDYEQGFIHQLEKAIEETTETTETDQLESSSLEDSIPHEQQESVANIPFLEILDSDDIAHYIDSDDDLEAVNGELEIDADTEKDEEGKELEESTEEEDDDQADDLKDDDYITEDEELDKDEEDGLDYEQFESCLDDDLDRFEEAPESCFVPRKKKWSAGPLDIKKEPRSAKIKKILDDGNAELFKKRLAKHRLYEAEENLVTNEQYNEIIDIGENLRIPKRIWDRLFEHQQECLLWMWGLHRDLCGGVMGDEMGLGKTIQVIAYFIALKHTTYREVGHLYPTLGPVLLVCPATVMHHWVTEFHKWWPPFRVAILHSMSTHRGQKKELIREIFKASGVLITSYNGVCIYNKELVELSWHYVVLDEGHKIRNPTTQVTNCCKRLKTPHRLILSGSPMQNNLREIWSLFDFVYPEKLGSLNTFMNEVAHPISRGSYCNANDLQRMVGYKCTLMLRDTIQPYMLRRTKDEVKMELNLPDKNEQVLFCKLTDIQRELYIGFIETGIIRDICRGDADVLPSLIKVRNICNHPFLFHPVKPDTFDGKFFRQSGKMAVVIALLKLWHKQKHKVLFFTQSRKMLDLLEKFMQRKEYTYYRMDGTTSMALRQHLVDDFNNNPARFVFLLTTRVGGIGINLTGASRVIIFDPDWNPCTDMQARERCWRIGQDKDVIIYRLLTAGTVEEKMYHRQIYKQYLTNSVLKDPNHRRFFKMNDLQELFTLSDINETSLMFADSKVKFNKKPSKKESEEKEIKSERKPNQTALSRGLAKQTTTKGMLMSSSSSKLPRIPKKAVETSEKYQQVPLFPEVTLSEEKRQELREKARALSRKIELEYNCGKKIEPTNGDRKVDNGCSSLGVKTPKVPDSKRSKEGIKCEGKRIKYLVAQEDFEEDAELKDDKKNKKQKTKDSEHGKKEDYILNKLLGSSIDAVLQHDTIENVRVPDHYYLEKEADRIAKEAIEKLRRCESRPSTSIIGGSNFTVVRQVNATLNTNRSPAGAANALTRTGVSAEMSAKYSSSNVIAALRAKQGINVNKSTNGEPFFKGNRSFPSTSSSSTATSSSSGGRILENNELLSEIRDFVHHKAALPYQATNKELVKHFKRRNAPEKSAIFKSMLLSLCDCEGNGDDTIYRLKREFYLR